MSHSAVFYGPYSPKEFSNIGTPSDFASDGTAGTLNRKLYDDIGDSTAIKSAEPIIVLGNIYILVSR